MLTCSERKVRRASTGAIPVEEGETSEVLKKAGAVVVKSNVGVEAASAGKEMRSVADVT